MIRRPVEANRPVVARTHRRHIHGVNQCFICEKSRLKPIGARGAAVCHNCRNRAVPTGIKTSGG